MARGLPPPPPTLGAPGGFVVEPRRLLQRLLNRVDVDRDGRITAADLAQARTRALSIDLAPGLQLRLAGAERLSGLAAMLAGEIRRGNADRAVVPLSLLAPTRIDRALTQVAQTWQALQRSANSVESLQRAVEEGLLRARDGRAYLYVPEGDEPALRRLERQARGKAKVVVVPFPRRRVRVWQQRMEHDAGIAYLPRPYLVPGGMFTELYGWDSYFQARGALAAGKVDLARDVAENLAYEIRHYGKIANTNRSYHLSRTQPPLSTSLARAVFEELERRGDPDALGFLGRCARAAELTTEGVWRRAPRATPLGLSRYHDEATGPCPEVPASFYARHPQTPAFWDHDRAQRESGWDLTHRWGDEAHLHVPVCLNALLYRQERDLAAMFRRLEGARSARAAKWDRRARERRELIDRHLWDSRRGLYFDWSLSAGKRSSYETLASFYPLWVGLASGKQAARVAENLELFLEPGGLATSSRRSRAGAPSEPLQWDWPIGWAPLQVIAVEGLRRYGFHALADRVAYRWLHLVFRVAGEQNGSLKEKYDVVAGSAEVVSSEYQNQGDDFGRYLDDSGVRGVGFGWTNASIPLLLAGLDDGLRQALELDVPASQAGV
ncbi:MAG: trehalase [Deltaproteobacteria bacterium]|nr:trehalase [Deltaproteobacteria bacterium]